MNIREIFRRGTAAKTLMENEAFRDAVRSVRDDLVDEWCASKVRDHEGREKLYLTMRMLDEVVSRVEQAQAEMEFELAKQEQDKPHSADS